MRIHILIRACNAPLLERETDRDRDRNRNRNINRETDRQTESERDRDRERDRERRRERATLHLDLLLNLWKFRTHREHGNRIMRMIFSQYTKSFHSSPTLVLNWCAMCSTGPCTK